MAYSTDRPSPGRASWADDGPQVVAVVIPARNEATYIAACLESVRVAAAHLPGGGRSGPALLTVVVLDSCSDRTGEIVAAVAPEVHAIAVDCRRVGSARRAGVDHALHLAGGRSCWLASTDADSTVPPDWLRTMLALARGGADLVLGTVHPDPGLAARIAGRWRAGYRDEDGHRHVHGANLGITAQAYRVVGGWPRTRCHEDAILAHRVEAAGLRIARTAAIPVRTSGRLVGRAPGGFAVHLAALAALPADRAR